ncbi:MAG TPA: DUF3052 family protein [Bacteroidota bacterium]|nr:DUF3052 family protein [Bacteroidota bacterium]
MKYEGKVFKGKALLETNELIFRGDHRLTIPFKKMKSVDADESELTVVFDGGTASFTIEKRAEQWQDKILHPKSVLDKLGVKEDSLVSVKGITDKDFLNQLTSRAKSVSVKDLREDSDIIFYAADNKKDLEKLNDLKRHLKSNGALWIVSLKGKRAKIKDTDVMSAGKKAGLVDVKVVSFSETQTALKFVVPVDGRK